jgi:hypothetical protein
MLTWFCSNAIPLTNMLGIALDIAGAYLVAYEVVRRFEGEKYESAIGSGPIDGVPTIDAPTETKAFQQFESRRFRRMQLGLILLTIGFALQFIANAVQLRSAA